MSKLSTTKMSSKGQVVIPEEIRKRLKLKEGSQFIVIGEKDVVILKSINPPSIKDFDDIIIQARKYAEKSGMKKANISAAITKVRGKN
ncbi:MAG: AbrB/MazE/SpoVT family DNA-binding domain-containing protein [bacterium]